MSDLIAFLRARLDEDEAAARAAVEPERPGIHWAWFDGETDEEVVPTLDREYIDEESRVSLRTRERYPARMLLDNMLPAFPIPYGQEIRSGVAAHIARWDPARVLAEVAAKRAVAALHTPCHVESDPWSCTSGHYGSRGIGLDGTQPARCGVCVESFLYEETLPSPCPTLLALVQPYAAHPDFDPAWRIS